MTPYETLSARRDYPNPDNPHLVRTRKLFKIIVQDLNPELVLNLGCGLEETKEDRLGDDDTFILRAFEGSVETLSFDIDPFVIQHAPGTILADVRDLNSWGYAIKPGCLVVCENLFDELSTPQCVKILEHVLKNSCRILFNVTKYFGTVRPQYFYQNPSGEHIICAGP